MKPRLERRVPPQRERAVPQQRQSHELRQHRRLVQRVQLEQRFRHGAHLLPVPLCARNTDQLVQGPPHGFEQSEPLGLEPALETGSVVDPDSLEQVAAPERPRVALPVLCGAVLELHDVGPNHSFPEQQLVLRRDGDHLSAKHLVDERRCLRQRMSGAADVVLGPEQVSQLVARLRLALAPQQKGEQGHLLPGAEAQLPAVGAVQRHRAEASELEGWAADVFGRHHGKRRWFGSGIASVGPSPNCHQNRELRNGYCFQSSVERGAPSGGQRHVALCGTTT